MKRDEKQLTELLPRAAEKLKALGHNDIWNSDYYCDDLGIFCDQAAEKLKNNSLSDEEKKKLYFIFAPTCEWDDSVGDIALGNMIFGLLERLYKDIALR